MNNNIVPNIIIIEDDDDFSAFLKNKLLHEGFNAKIAKSGLKALNKLKVKNVDIIISSYYLPNISGDDFYKEIKRKFSGVPVIFLSKNVDSETIADIIRHDKSDFITKPVVISELVARIKVLLEEKSSIGTLSKLQTDDLIMDLESFKVKRNNKKIELSPTEFSLLRYLLINKGSVLTRGMILSRVWGYDTDVSSRAVDVYIGYLRDKIDSGHKVKLIETVRGFGYRIADKKIK